MNAVSLLDPLSIGRGPSLKNRFVLAPLTNLQSHADGCLSEDEFRWLTMRAKGGFGLTMRCAAHVQAVGQGYPGQLGIFSELHLDGLTRLAGALRDAGSVSAVQLHHSGRRAERALVAAPVAPSDDAETGARGLSLGEVEQLIEDFVQAASRAERAGFDGVEVHGAHDYIISAFLSADTNRRTDRYGGSLQNRNRLLRDILDGIRDRCGRDFQLGLRLSTERFGISVADTTALAQELMTANAIDYLDLSLWDVDKMPREEAFRDRSLLSYFTSLDRGQVKLGAAGKIMTADHAQACLNAGLDFVVLGRAAILHHDYPRRVDDDAAFRPVDLPVSRDYLSGQGLGAAFIGYMTNWKGFVAD